MSDEAVDKMKAFFEKHDDEHGRFERVPAERRLSQRSELHAMILLDRLVPGDSEMIISPHYDGGSILDIDLSRLAASANEQDLLDLIRCGVGIANEMDDFLYID
jgi:hypothetical protein